MNKLAVVYFFAVFTSINLAIAENNDESAIPEELVALCKEIMCRPSQPVNLKLSEEETLDITVRFPTPIIADGLVTVYPGETVYVEATVDPDGWLTDLKAVAENRKPKSTLTFHLWQEPDIGDGLGMLLTVNSPFGQIIKYRLGMMLPDGGDLYSTSSCPLRPGITVSEHWPHPIFQIVATDFRLVADDSEGATTCE
jgi:hypothetical protein